MADRRRLYRIGLVALLAISLFACLLTGGVYAKGPVRQISFTQHVTPLGATPIPGMVAFPTPGHGQYFDESTEDQIPDVARPELLDDPIGYSAVLGYPGLYLIWSTDDSGNRHYYVLQESSEYFQRIQATVDANLQARTELDETNPWLRLGWSAVRIVGGVEGAIFCGIATGATLETPPLAAVFGTCTLGALGFAGLGIDGFIDVYNGVRAYENRTENDRLAIEGIFREIASAPSQ
jgi:hypothetical protein